MTNRTAILIVLASILFTGSAFLFKTVKFNNQEQASNWPWEDEWEHKTSPLPEQIVEDKPEVKPEVKTQIMASTYKEAVQKSGELGMPVLCMFTADWCGYCRKMKSETMIDKDVVLVMKNYILVYVNSDNDRDGIRKFGIVGLPSCVITNYKEDNLKFVSGFQSASPFSKWLDDPKLYSQPKADKEPEPKKEPEVKKQKIRL